MVASTVRTAHVIIKEPSGPLKNVKGALMIARTPQYVLLILNNELTKIPIFQDFTLILFLLVINQTSINF